MEAEEGLRGRGAAGLWAHELAGHVKNLLLHLRSRGRSLMCLRCLGVKVEWRVRDYGGLLGYSNFYGMGEE